jgi:hypothetical protein
MARIIDEFEEGRAVPAGWTLRATSEPGVVVEIEGQAFDVSSLSPGDVVEIRHSSCGAEAYCNGMRCEIDADGKIHLPTSTDS